VGPAGGQPKKPVSRIFSSKFCDEKVGKGPFFTGARRRKKCGEKSVSMASVTLPRNSFTTAREGPAFTSREPHKSYAAPQHSLE
jgi:hypothetical protein